MARVRKLILILLIILLLLTALIFSLNNRTAVSLQFLGYETPEIGLAVWLISALVFGALLGIIVSSLASFNSGRKRKHLEKKLAQSERALERQRSGGEAKSI